MEKSILITSPEDFAKATISKDGETIRTKIRLKGDQLDHLKGKMVYRFNEDNKSLWDEKFSLQAQNKKLFY